MTKQEFKNLTQDEVIILDGATGTNLMRSGMPAGVCPEEWILNNREVLINLQQEYIKAGTNIIYAPTFTCNRLKLEEYGYEEKIVEWNQQLIELSQEAIQNSKKKDVYIAADLTMTGQQLQPMGKLEFETLIDIYKEQVTILLDTKIDFFVVETMMSLQETRAALIAIKECCELPVMVSMSFEKDGRTLYGTDPLTAALVCESLGADAFGFNCSSGPENMLAYVKQLKGKLEIPIIVKPNAGMPKATLDGGLLYEMDEIQFAEEMKPLIEAGASIVGGCCGTTPAHIKALSTLINEKKYKRVKNKIEDFRYITSDRNSFLFHLNDPFFVVGERINPTGKKKLQEQIREKNYDLVVKFTEEQENCGAKVLDVNVGMSGIDEKETMLEVLEIVNSQTSLPLSIDTSNIEVMEAALRKYPGRALMNSISYEKHKCEALLTLAKKYGAMFILLPLSDTGLPKNIEEKKEIIQNILAKSDSIGIDRRSIVVDGLVTTVAANKNAALETIETIKYCKEQGLPTTCGLSNISFGLPERSYINTSFLTLAIQAGLSMAIANPSQTLLVNSAYATDLLLAKPGSDMNYIDRMNAMEPMKLIPAKVETKEVITKEIMLEANSNKEDNKLFQCVLKGQREKSMPLVQTLLEEGMGPQEVLHQVLLPAIGKVGELFDKGIYFLPQLIASAETMKLAIEFLEPLLLQEAGKEEMPTVVIATVKGDIHDIGKNLVALMLKNHGFKVYDLGKDVSKELIIEKAKETNAAVIALSALMTTTMQEMKHVIDYVKEQNVTSKVIIGGAVITEEYAKQIGADGYSSDAANAVKLAKNLLGL